MTNVWMWSRARPFPIDRPTHASATRDSLTSHERQQRAASNAAASAGSAVGGSGGSRFPGMRDMTKRTIPGSNLNYWMEDRPADHTEPKSVWSKEQDKTEGSRSMETSEHEQCQPLPNHDGKSNLKFYKKKMESLPKPGFTIEDMLEWKGDYKWLNEYPFYIQWLFPIPHHSGSNLYAQPLENDEAEAIQRKPELKKRLRKAFKMMLDFFGMKLNTKTGEISHAKHFQERVPYFNGHSSHTKITRILTSLGALGHKDWQLAWLYYILFEMFDKNNLPLIDENTMAHWIEAVSDDHEKTKLFDRYYDWRSRMNAEQQSEASANAELKHPGTSVDEGFFKETETAPSDWNDYNESGTEHGAKSPKYVYTERLQVDMSKAPNTPVGRDGVGMAEKPYDMKGKEKEIKKNDDHKPKTSIFHRTAGGDIPSRKGTPSLRLNANVEFYNNKKRSNQFLMFGDYIEDMLKWRGDYGKLESNHRYIQWLFPIPDSSGMNPAAQPLQEHEAEEIRSRPELKWRVQQAYEMMLDFYGMRLRSRDTGEIDRAKNWKDRYSHLNSSMHNYLRITRIIKSLGHLGFPHYQSPWLTFILHEVLIHKTLPRLNQRDRGPIRHWIWAISDETERQDMFFTFYELSGQSTQAAKADCTLPRPDPNADSEPSDDDEPNTPETAPTALQWSRKKQSPASPPTQEHPQSHLHPHGMSERQMPSTYSGVSRDAGGHGTHLPTSSSQGYARQESGTMAGIRGAYENRGYAPATADRPLPPLPPGATQGRHGQSYGTATSWQHSSNRSSGQISDNVHTQHNRGPPKQSLNF